MSYAGTSASCATERGGGGNGPVSEKRYTPPFNADGANWSRRYYFRRAHDRPGTVQVTRPYLSNTGANQCITVSIGTRLNGEMLVLCGDVNWHDRAAVKR